MRSEFAILIAVLPVLCMVVSLVIGTLRYIKHGDEIKKRVTEDFREKRAEGGINELFFKRPDKRVAFETFGIPICIGLAVGLILIFIIFKLF